MDHKHLEDVAAAIDCLVQKGQESFAVMIGFDQAKVDTIVRHMALAGIDHHMVLAKAAIEETGRGVYEDKVIKNLFATEHIYHSIKYLQTVGVIEDNAEENYAEIVGKAF